MIQVVDGVSDLWILLNCACDVCDWSRVAEDEIDCKLISGEYNYNNIDQPPTTG